MVICIKKEPFPRIFSTRNRINDGSDYFGPYASGKMMHTLLDLIRQLYQIRSCSLNLSAANIKTAKYKVCLEYHINNCLGPCENLQTEENYTESLNEIRNIIKGNISAVRQHLVGMMKQYAEDYHFEKAQLVKEKIELLDRYQSKSTIVSPSIHNIDIFSYVDEPTAAYINFMKVISGCIIQAHTVEIRKKLDESPDELLLLAITELRERFDSDAPEIIVPFKPEVQFPGVTYTTPIRGEKKKLLELSERNAKYYQIEKHKQLERVDPERHTLRIMEQMKTDLRLKEHPVRIDCFDNSNIQGAYPVAAMVVFINGKPDKKEYRHFNIKTAKATYEKQIEDLNRQIADMGKEQTYLKTSNTQVLNQLEALSVISGSQAESIKKSMENIGMKDAYIHGLQTSLAQKDSLNMALVMNLKGAIGNLADEDINIKVDKGVVFIDISDKMLFKSGYRRDNRFLRVFWQCQQWPLCHGVLIC